MSDAVKMMGILVAGVVGVTGVVIGSSLYEKQAIEKEKHRHDESMPDSYWEAKKAEAEASIEIKKLDNEKEIEIKKLDNEKAIKLQADRFEAEKNMPDGYFKAQETESLRKKEENIARIQAESNEKIERERHNAEIQREKERNKSNETLIKEARQAINTIRNFT